MIKYVLFAFTLSAHIFAVDQTRERDLGDNKFAFETKATTYIIQGKEVLMLSAFAYGEKNYFDSIKVLLKDCDSVIYPMLGTPQERRGEFSNTDISNYFGKMKETFASIEKELGLELMINQIPFAEPKFKFAGISLLETKDFKSFSAKKDENKIHENMLSEFEKIRTLISRSLIYDIHFHSPIVFDEIKNLEIFKRIQKLETTLHEVLAQPGVKKIAIVADPLFDFFADEIVRKLGTERKRHQWLTAFTYARDPWVKQSCQGEECQIFTRVRQYKKGSITFTLFSALPYGEPQYFRQAFDLFKGATVLNASFLPRTEFIKAHGTASNDEINFAYMPYEVLSQHFELDFIGQHIEQNFHGAEITVPFEDTGLPSHTALKNLLKSRSKGLYLERKGKVDFIQEYPRTQEKIRLYNRHFHRADLAQLLYLQSQPHFSGDLDVKLIKKTYEAIEARLFQNTHLALIANAGDTELLEAHLMDNLGFDIESDSFVRAFSYRASKHFEMQHLHNDDASFMNAVTTFWNGHKTVKLIGMTHIGQKSFYDAVHQELAPVERVIFEAVGTSQELENKNAIYSSIILDFLKKIGGYEISAHNLGLVSQDSSGLCFDLFNKTNCVHGDLRIKRAQEIKQNESEITSLSLFKTQAIGISLASDAQLIESLLQKCTPQKNIATVCQEEIKRRQDEGRGETRATVNSKTFSFVPTTILYDFERNDEAMFALKEELKNFQSIAIIYGAAHLRDFEHQLIKLGFKQIDKKWLEVMKY